MKKVNVKLLSDRILLKVDSPEEKTKGGIYIPLATQEMPLIAEVIAVGPGKKDEIMEVEVGNKVRYAKHSAMEIEIDEEKYLLTRQADIHLILL